MGPALVSDMATFRSLCTVAFSAALFAAPLAQAGQAPPLRTAQTIPHFEKGVAAVRPPKAAGGKVLPTTLGMPTNTLSFRTLPNGAKGLPDASRVRVAVQGGLYARSLYTVPRQAMRDVLAAGRIIGARDHSHPDDANRSQIVEIEWGQGDGTFNGKPTVTAIVKGRRDSRIGDAMHRGVPMGEQFIREAAVSRAADVLDVPFVPPTTTRVIQGERKSIQVIVSGAMEQTELAPNTRTQLNRAAAEKLRVFDYIIGNSDRKGNLLLYEQNGEFFPVAHDNGVTLPEGPMPAKNPEFAWPMALTRTHSGRLLPETSAWIGSIDDRKVAQLAQAFAKAGLGPEATTHALRRLERVRAEFRANGTCSFLELPSEEKIAQVAGAPHELNNLIDMARAGSSYEQGLRPEALRRIDHVVRAAYER
jgi:hypothetical protein